MSSETAPVATSSKVTCRINAAYFTHQGVTILEAARLSALSYCSLHDSEKTVEVHIEYSHDGRVIRDSVQVRVELKATVVNPRNGEED